MQRIQSSSDCVSFEGEVAYLLMIHGDESIVENVKYLVEALDDASAIMLIHVDLRYQHLYDTVSNYISEREVRMNERSLVWIELSGFWELMDLAEWKHVINLSAMDLPLRKSKEIGRILGMPKNSGNDFIKFEDSTDIGNVSASIGLT
ncbi:hypothetical protein HDU97_007186 [Phlyctochytrium planicorne]|nr:hypothetical protein HDU97_007186 [Phlyctochytrium planicorne]